MTARSPRAVPATSPIPWRPGGRGATGRTRPAAHTSSMSTPSITPTSPGELEGPTTNTPAQDADRTRVFCGPNLSVVCYLLSVLRPLSLPPVHPPSSALCPPPSALRLRGPDAQGQADDRHHRLRPFPRFP